MIASWNANCDYNMEYFSGDMFRFELIYIYRIVLITRHGY